MGASGTMLDWIDDVPPNVKAEMQHRYDELTRLETEQIQIGTAVPQLYGSLSRFIANPSTVSVETYKRMLDTDDTVGAGIDFLNLAMLARFGDYKHKSPEITYFVRQALAQMDGSWHENLEEMLSAEWAGFSITEELWKCETDFCGGFAYVPKKLVTYPPLTLVFAVDRHGELLEDGIYQYQRFHNTFFNSFVFGIRAGDIDGFRPDLFASIGDFPYPIRIASDLTYLTVKIPRHKIIHLKSSVSGKFGNPYGRSSLRRAYKHWVAKDAFLKMYIVAADRKGTPLVVGYADTNTTLLQQTNNEFNHGGVNKGRADMAMAEIMKTIHNSSFIVLPGKKGEIYEVEAIQVQGDMNIFKDGMSRFDQGIMRALLIPPLAMTNGDGVGSFALAQEHTKLLAKMIDGKLKIHKQGILQQFIRKILQYNFPRAAWEKDGLGDFVLEEYDAEAMEKLANIYSSLTTSGYMSPSDQEDMTEVRMKMNLKPKVATVPITEDPLNPLDDKAGSGNDPTVPEFEV